MKTLLYISILILPAVCRADTFILKDGVRLEGEVTGEMDGALLVKTRYGSLTISNGDIQERTASVPAPAAPAEPSTAAATAPRAPAEQLPALPAGDPAPGLTFATIAASTSSRQLVYYEAGVAIATETFGADGAPAALEGAVKDGTYTEYYPDGALKTVKSMLGGKASGTLKAFYPGAVVQVEAYYMGGVKEGPFRYFTPDGKLLLEAEYRGDRLNGWKKEYGPDGALKTQTYYQDDQPAEPPKPPAEPAAAPAERDSMVTVKTVKVARGESFSFHLNGKYIGKAKLDKEFNLIGLEGRVPDGVVKVYAKDGKLVKELVFEKNELRGLRVYEPGGPLQAEYSYAKEKAVKK